MRIYSYVIARDFGFAPNPFHGTCTLATCKPIIRRGAKEGDWIIGTGSAGRGKRGHLIFAMRVSETLSFNEYWNDPRFQCKKPNLNAAKKQAFGDNIYFQDDDKGWHQLNSHHSFSNGEKNMSNVVNDTQTNRMLLSTEFAYWGEMAPLIPQCFRDFEGQDICAVRGHKINFSKNLVTSFVDWFHSQNSTGFIGAPIEWKY